MKILFVVCTFLTAMTAQASAALSLANLPEGLYISAAHICPLQLYHPQNHPDQIALEPSSDPRPGATQCSDAGKLFTLTIKADTPDIAVGKFEDNQASMSVFSDTSFEIEMSANTILYRLYTP